MSADKLLSSPSVYICPSALHRPCRCCNCIRYFIYTSAILYYRRSLLQLTGCQVKHGKLNCSRKLVIRLSIASCRSATELSIIQMCSFE